MAYDIIVGRSEGDRKKFGNKGSIFLGRSYVKMGRTTSLSNSMFLDVNRTHVFLVAGKRGSGKCITGDTLIPLSDGSLLPIEKLNEDKSKIFGLNNSLKINSLEKSEFFEREVKRIIKLRLRSGREIKLTPEHPLLTIKGWKPVQELNIGGRIATERKIECFGNGNMEDYNVKILAYLIAEGHTKNSYCLFSNSDEKILNEFKESINQFDSNLKVVEWPKGCSGCYGVTQIKKQYEMSKEERNEKGQFIIGGARYKKSSIVDWLIKSDCYGKKAIEKEIPQTVFRLKKEKVKLFLNRLFSCDGSIYKHKGGGSYIWEISYSSSSEKLIRQVQHLLLRFGILSKLRNKRIKCNNKEFKSYELCLNPANVIKFVEEIGFFGVKQSKEDLAVKETLEKIRNSNVDTIPIEIWDLFKPQSWAEIGRAFNYKYPKSMRERIKYCPSRETLLQIAEVENNEAITKLATSDIFWDEIVSMEILDGKFKVYDFSVPEHHNFVANDIIVHNSYSLGVITEGMVDLPTEVAEKLSVIILDTMGIFWTMKYPNDKDEDLLKEWNFKPKGLDVKVYVPKDFYEKFKQQGVLVDKKFAINPAELNAEEWCLTFKIDLNDAMGVLIEKATYYFRDKNILSYDLDDMIKVIRNDKETSQDVKNAVINRFESAKNWGVFDKEATNIGDIAKGGQASVIDVSCYNVSEGGWEIKSLVIGIICRKLFNERMLERKKEELELIKRGFSYIGSKEIKQEKPMVWVIIDEAHEFLPETGKTSATDALITILREGRQPGVSLILATQQPGRIHRDVMTQADLVLSHRLTAKNDIQALNEMMQSYMTTDLITHMNNLPDEAGAAILLDDSSERIYPIRVRPRFTWHGGESPSALSIRKKLDLGLD